MTPDERIAEIRRRLDKVIMSHNTYLPSYPIGDVDFLLAQLDAANKARQELFLVSEGLAGEVNDLENDLSDAHAKLAALVAACESEGHTPEKAGFGCRICKAVADAKDHLPDAGEKIERKDRKA